jgi:hypothetical protein
MSRNGQIIQPNAMSVETTYAEGPLAQPSTVVLPQPGKVSVLTLGGLTKAESLAGQIASGYTGSSFTGDVATYAAKCLDLAQEILAESARRAKPPAETHE